MTAPAAARKNQWGNRVYPVPRPGTEIVEDLPAVSQLLKILAAPGLEIWKQKMIAEQFAIRPDLVMLAANPDTRWDAIKQALDAGRNASNTGTAIHHFTEQVDAGQVAWELVPAVAKPWVESYQKAKDDYGWTMVAKEFTVYNHELGYAGTSDRILDIPGYGKVIADVKTGKSVYADMAQQMACYAFGEGIWTAPLPEILTESIARDTELDDWIANGTNIPAGRRKWSEEAIKEAKAALAEERWREYARKGTHTPLPADLRKDVAIIVHLSENGCELVPLDLTGTYEVIAGLAHIYHWQQRKNVVGAPIEIESAVVVQQLQETIAGLQGQEGSSTGGRAEPTASETGTSSEEPVPFEPAPEPVLDTSSRRASVQARIDSLTPKAKQDLVFKWPEGIPTLKKWDGHSPEQLKAIEDVLWDVECEQGIDKLADAFPGSSAA